jgi:hypothetical protein
MGKNTASPSSINFQHYIDLSPKYVHKPVDSKQGNHDSSPPLPYCLKNNHIRLQAINPHRNIFREYVIHLSRGVLQNWIVQIGYGRIARPGHVKTFSFDDENSAHTFIKSHLKRRLSAPKRLGCSYVCV